MRGPLAASYAAAVALVVCALVPFLLLSSALIPLEQVVGKDVGLGRGAFELTAAMSDAAYAFGTVLAVQLAQHVPARRLLLGYVSAFAVVAALAAWAPTNGVFVAAYVVEGLCTSLMLIAAVPPFVTGFPASRMPWTGAIMNLCIFGAVAAGPSIGAFAAAEKSWRPLFAVVAGIELVAVVLSLLTYEDQPPQDRSAPWDFVALALAGGGCTAAFLGAAELEIHRRASPLALALLACGVAAVVALIVYEYRLEQPLMPVRQLATTLPVAGVLVALCGSSAAFGMTAVALTALQKASPSHTALLFLPELGAALATAALFGTLFRTRFTPVLAFGGLAVLTAAAAVLTGVARGGDTLVALGAGLLGLGVGSAVSPGLFIAGFSLRSAQIQRVFALIELLRGVGAFLTAPVLLYLAAVIGTSEAAGIHAAVLVCLVLAAAGAAGAAAIFLLGGARLQRPNLERWNDEGESAWSSPPLLARLREEPERHVSAAPAVRR
jgi:predicted MFS family arabinose efflux permease